jgi:hypothetical protein
VSAIIWIGVHQREAEARLFELFGEVTRTSPGSVKELRYSTTTEAGYRRSMADIGLPSARIDREVRRVNRLASGVWVREVLYEVRAPCGRARYGSHDAALVALAGTPGGHLFHVTRIGRSR